MSFFRCASSGESDVGGRLGGGGAGVVRGGGVGVARGDGTGDGAARGGAEMRAGGTGDAGGAVRIENDGCPGGGRESAVATVICFVSTSV